MRTILTTLLCIVPFLSGHSQEISTTDPLLLIEEIQSELAAGRISIDDAELLTEWIEHVDDGSLHGWIEQRTEISSELLKLPHSWLAIIESKNKTVDSADEKVSRSVVRSRIAITRRESESTFREFLSFQASPDQQTRVSIDFSHEGDDSVQIRRRSIRFRPTAGLFEEVTLGSLSVKLGTGLLVAPSRPQVTSSGSLPDGFLFPSSREMNGILLKSGIGKMPVQLLGSIRKRQKESHALLAIELNRKVSTKLNVGIVAGLSRREDSVDTRTDIPASLTLNRQGRNHSIALEIGGLADESFAHPGLNGRLYWQSGGESRHEHRLKYWWYEPRWREFVGNGSYMNLAVADAASESSGSNGQRAGQYGFRYDFIWDTQGDPHRVFPRLAVVFGRRAADTFGVMLEPSVRLPLKTATAGSSTMLELVGQLRSRKPSRSAANFFDEGEVITAEVQFRKSRAEFSHKLGMEILNDKATVLSQLMAQLRHRDWAYSGRALIRNISSSQRTVWRISAEIRRNFLERSFFLRSLVQNNAGTDGDGQRLFVLEGGLAWSW